MIGAFAGIVADNTETTPDQITFSSDPHAELAQLLAVSDQQAALLAGELTPDRSGTTLHGAQRAQSKQFDAISNRLNSLRADQFHVEYKAFHYGLRVTAGMDLVYDNLLLQPIIAGELNNVSIEAYDESGSVASLL